MTSAELITELQASKPAADGALRDRVRAIATAEPVRPRSLFDRLGRMSPRRFTLVAVPAMAVLLLAVAGVAGLLGSGSQPGGVEAIRNDLSSQSSTAPGTTTSPAYEAAPALKAGAASGATDAATPAPTPGRAQRYSAQLSLTVKDIDALSDATQQALRITRDLGGYLVTVSYATTESGVSSLTLKVPAANVQQAIVRLSSLGTIVGQQVQIDDLQGQIDDLTRRETALRQQIARLSARLASTELSAETRATLAARRDAARSELAGLQAAHTQIAAEAQFATIQLTMQTPEASTVVPAPSRFDNAVDRAVEILAVEAMVLIYALVIAGPLAILLVLAWLTHRSVRKRQETELLSTR